MPNLSGHMKRVNSQHGFTMLELMTALAVASVLVALAVPNFRTFFLNNRLTSAANDLFASSQRARTEAIKRQANVVLCGTDDPDAADPVCTFGAGTGWIVFQDTNGDWQASGAPAEPIIERHAVLDPEVQIRGDGEAVVSFGATGFAAAAGPHAPTRNIVFCDSRGATTVGNTSTARALVVAPTGHAQVSSLAVDVVRTLLATGACP